MPAKFLSWNSARLLALMLNSLTGLVEFLQKESAENLANIDTLLTLRFMQENLLALDGNFRGDGLHPGIFQAIRNLSSQIEELKANKNLYDKNNELIRKFEPILRQNIGFKFGKHKLLDERLRWTEKEQKGMANEIEMESTKIEQFWLENGTNSLERCILATLLNCTLPQNCLMDELHSKGKIGFQLTRQILLFRIIFIDELAKKCTQNQLPSMNAEEKEKFLNEKCTNIWDEMNGIVQGKQRKNKLARIQIKTLGLVAEQVFLCGHQGFVQFGNPHLLLAMLSWQHPELGCWTTKKAEPVPDFGMKAAIKFEHLRGFKMSKHTEKESRKEDECLVHTSLLIGLALSGLFLRLLLDPGPWPEQHGLAEAQFDGMMAEDKFHAFPYLEWVQDAEPIEQGIRLLRPPQSSWSPDLVAFVCLLFIIVLAFVIFIHFCGDEGHPPGRPRKGGIHKKLYPYAFKKL